MKTGVKKKGIKFRLLPVILFTAVVLLLLKARAYNFDIGNLQNIPIDSNTTRWDVFSYVKADAIFYISVFSAVVMAYLLITRQMKIKKTRIYIPMLIYAICVILSCLSSEFKSVAFMGSVDRFEGTRTILCYIFMLFYTINAVDEFRDALIVVMSTISAAFLACLIGLTQFLGQDILLSKLTNILITGGMDNILTAQFWPGQVYQTVNNMNYVGMYLSMIVPILLYGIYYLYKKENRYSFIKNGISNEKRIAILIILALFLMLVALNIYGAGSIGGVLGISVSIAVLLVTIAEKKWLKTALISMLFIGLTGSLIVIYLRGVDTHRQVDYIKTGVDEVTISINGNDIKIVYLRDEGKFEVRDSKEHAIRVYCFEGEEGRYQVDDARFAGQIVVEPMKDVNNNPCVVADLYDNAFGFTFYEDGAKYLNPFGQEVDLDEVKSFGFEGHLCAGNGRGYIWSRTLPLLRHRLLLGYGADTFLLIFPQDDYAGRYSIGSPLQINCDKPHNMYLLMILGTGLISFFAFVTMISMAMYKVFCLSNDKLYVKIIAAGLLGFLTAGMFYDSSVSTMPMFYGLFGIMIAGSIKEWRS